jgi:hypothetical protein
MELKKVAMITAARGENTRVETTVAIEFAASVAPFTNSAAKTKPSTIRSPGVNSPIKDCPPIRIPSNYFQ